MAAGSSSRRPEPMSDAAPSSWELFASAWIASWLIAGVQSLLGIAVLARGQVFLGAAMSQAATAGVAAALCVLGAVPWRAHAEVVAAMLAAIATAFAVGIARRHRDAVAAWIFLAAGAAAVLLVAQSPYGMDEVQRLLASSIVGASPVDAAVFGVLGAGVGAIVLANAARLRVLLLDPAFAAAIGIRTARWEAWIAIILGLSVGWALHVAGLLYTFGALVLPAMAARLLGRELATLAWLSPAIAIGLAVLGTACADAWDLPPAQVVVAFWASAVGAAAGIRALRALG